MKVWSSPTPARPILRAASGAINSQLGFDDRGTRLGPGGGRGKHPFVSATLYRSRQMALLFHIDESADGRYHFHLGALADGFQIAAAERDLEKVARDAVDAGLPKVFAELHGAEMAHGGGDWSNVSLPDRLQLLEAALSVIGAYGIELISRGVHLDAFRAKYGPGSPYTWLFRNLLERLNERLKSRDSYGLVIADEQHQYRHVLLKDLIEGQRYTTPGYRGQRLDRIVDTAHFVDSKLSRMIQLADMAVYIRRRRERGPEADPRAEAVMARLSGLVSAGVPDPSWQYNTVWQP